MGVVEITIKRDLADDLESRAAEMYREAISMDCESSSIRRDGKLLKAAADVVRNYQVLSGNGVPDKLARLIAVTYKA